MLLVNVHQLDVVLADSIALGALENEVDNIGRIFSLESEDVLVLGSTKDLLQRDEVDAKCDIAIASGGRERVGLEQHGNEGDVAVVHGLETDARVVTFEVAVLDEVLDGFDNLLEKVGLFETRLKHYERVSIGSS